MDKGSVVAKHVLAQLQKFGWEMGLKKLGQEINTTDDAEQQETLRFFAAWMAAERGAYGQAGQLFGELRLVDNLEAWAIFGQAFLALRQHHHQQTHKLLEEAESRADPEDRPLHAAIAHLRGASYYHVGDSQRALHYLRLALRLFGKDHFTTGRVLDTFGMVYASRDNFHAAEEFFKQAIHCKEQWDDQSGLALSFGNLGRLYLDWGYLDQAEQYFHRDLDLARRSGDARGEALMHDQLGRVALERGERAATQGRMAEARKHWAEATSWLDSSVQRNAAGGWTVNEGFARKDRALLALAEVRLPEAEAEVEEARARFEAAGFDEGLAHVSRVEGMIRRRRGAYDEASRDLRAALAHFESGKSPEQVQIARTLWELARTARDARAPRPAVSWEFEEALNAAEGCRRTELVRRIGEELKEIDPEAYYAHMFRRVRGRYVPPDTDSLISGVSELLTVLFLDLKGSTDYAPEVPSEVVMMTLNQMLADMTAVLRRYDALVSGFRGDGLMAIFRGQDHATRAVEVALDLFQELEEYNEPRRILDLTSFEVRIGISTGGAVLGNVGTYDLMDFTAIGTTVDLGASLQAEALPGFPCISRETHNEVRDRFTYREGSPRTQVLKGPGVLQLYEVAGRTPARGEPGGRRSRGDHGAGGVAGLGGPGDHGAGDMAGLGGGESDRPPTTPRSTSGRADRYRFSTFSPREVGPDDVGQIVAYASLETVPADVILRDVRNRLHLPPRVVIAAGSEGPVLVPRESIIKVTPDVPGLIFDSQLATMPLWEDYQAVAFRFKPRADVVGQVCRGWIHFWLGDLALADVSIRIIIEPDDVPDYFREALSTANAQPYRSVFPSYSHKDHEFVERLETYARSFGDEYLRDVQRLRAGQSWQPELMEFIKRANVFQLFWSENARLSDYVRQEWLQALRERIVRPDPHFLRPVYWTPEPASIPEELRELHFAKLPS
jgi:class 3 adenylate cyclase/Tfp pilus assembly protein PilF